MIDGKLTHRTRAEGIRLTLDDPAAVIDLGENPAYSQPIPVREINISYETTETFDGDTRTVSSKVTNIVYRVTHDEYDVVSVHPDFLDQPDEWPDWLPPLVEHHRPAI
ncbi:hypothetical protein AB0G67_40710 [Streptomyces sp. NPDC021056]|uniref:hypothetical protein n=1 Tax=Streptomyces sp. NPDC021056 TaxID=3155012 RepID=UPI003409ACD7